MFAIAAHEKIATIYQSHMRGVSAGAFGKAADISADTCWKARIEVEDGPVVLVRGSRVGWQVQFKGFVGEDADLETAARLALDAGKGIDITRDYSLNGPWPLHRN